MKRLAIAALLGCVVQFATVHAQESSGSPSAPSPAAPASPDDGRYTHHRVGDSLVRLDTRTGQVATCAPGPAGLVCQLAPDERAALEAEIGRLQGENAALKKELLARGLAVPGGARPDPVPAPPVAEAPPRPPQPVPAPKSPMDSEVERVKSFIGDIWRRLVEMVAGLQRDMQRKG